jgi:hypothetical protein
MPEWVEIWWQPLVGALHVLGVAWFGAAVFVEARTLRRVALGWMLATGGALWAANFARVSTSRFFWVKLALLGALAAIRRPRWLLWSLWAGVIVAARGIAYL